MNEFGIYPITRWTASHPKVADGVCGGGTRDTAGITYMLMVVDRPYGRVGTLTMNMQTNAAEANVTFPDDPGAAFNSNWASGAWHSGGLLQPDTLTYEEVSSVGGRNQSWMFNWNWGGIDSDGMVFGPLAPQKP